MIWHHIIEGILCNRIVALTLLDEARHELYARAEPSRDAAAQRAIADLGRLYVEEQLGFGQLNILVNLHG